MRIEEVIAKLQEAQANGVEFVFYGPPTDRRAVSYIHEEDEAVVIE
jgi:hypothetical protein